MITGRLGSVVNSITKIEVTMAAPLDRDVAVPQFRRDPTSSSGENTQFPTFTTLISLNPLIILQEPVTHRV